MARAFARHMTPRTTPCLSRAARAAAATAALYLAGCSNHTPGYGNFGIGENPAVNVTGSYPVEKNPDGTEFRWTNGHATYAIQPIAGAARPHVLAIKVNAFHPATLNVTVSGQRLLNQPLKIGPWSGEIDVSAIDFARPQSVELQSDTWIPEKVNGYTRPLGVQVMNLELR